MVLRRASLAALAPLLLAFAVVDLAGCGAGSTDAPKSIATKDRVDQIVEMRKIYDRGHGDWNALTDTDRAQYTKLAGDDAKAKQAWDRMGHPPGGGSSGPTRG